MAVLYDKRIPQGIPFLTQVTMGKVPGMYAVTITGTNSTTPATQAMLWQNTGVEARHTTARKVQFVSSSPNDTSNGTGAQRIEIAGLDADFNYVSEEFDTNGNTIVLSQFSYIRLFRVQVVRVGATGATAGTTTYTQQTSGELMATDGPSTVEARKAYYCIPNGYYGLLYRMQTSTTNPAAQIATRVIQRPPTGPAGNVILQMNTSQNYYANLEVPILIPPKNEIYFTSQALSGSPAIVSGNMTLVLVREDLINDNNIFAVEP